MAAWGVPEEIIENKEKIASIRMVDVRCFDCFIFIILIILIFNAEILSFNSKQIQYQT
jgi:hypothetical protein